MPRKWTVVVEPFPPRRPGCLYRTAVTAVEKVEHGKKMRVTFRHLDDEHVGRKHVHEFAMPPHPAGLTADFFRACDCNVTIGSKMRPEDCIGSIVGVRFAPAGDDDEIVAIEPIQKEDRDHAQPE